MIDTIDACRVCAKREIQPFFDLGRQPLANALAENQDQSDPVFPLSLSWCPQCGLVQLNQTVAPEAIFSQYVWVTSTSSTARDYAGRFCDFLLERAERMSARRYVLELASNDGSFLRPFQEKGLQVLGIDPAQNIVAMANNVGIPTQCAFFGAATAEQVVSERGKPGILFARNVLPHVADPHSFAEGMRLCMSEDTLLAIEVHYAKTILDELHYDSIYHEHLCYFTLKSLAWLLNCHGIHVYDIEESAISGGSIVVLGSLKEKQMGGKLLQYEEKEQRCGVNELKRWQGFAQTAREHRVQFLRLLSEAVDRGETMCGWGASARSSTLLNFCGVETGMISRIADKSKLSTTLVAPSATVRL